MDELSTRLALAPTGITGLDDILNGGLPTNRLYLIEGDPGAGKTTLALQFLLEGVRRGEAGLYVTLSETKDELVHVAAAHGWSLDDISLCELNTTTADKLRPDTQYTLFHPSEIELAEMMRLVVDQVERADPARVVLDSLAEMRLLARDSLRFRRQMLALKQFFFGRRSTVLLLDDESASQDGTRLQTIVNGVIVLEQLAPQYGAERRRLRVVKLRGLRYHGGYHDFMIRTGGLEVFPRIVAADTRGAFRPTVVPSGVAPLDALVGGGIERGTSTLIMGPAGAGKSAIATRYAFSAVERGELAAVYVFDESVSTFRHRSAGIGMELGPAIEAGKFALEQIDPAEMSPGEFGQRVRDAVTRDRARVVVIDSLNGYLNAMPEEQFLTAQLHELLQFLNQHDVATVLVCAQHGLLAAEMDNPIDVSYLADTVILMRYFEITGEVRQAISVVKRRTGGHERTLRELRIGPQGLEIGEPLREFEGVMTGTPRFLGREPPGARGPR
jgi:circadian clock protein KaiC